MRYDNHMHTFFSADSEMKAEEALEQAERLGLGIVFTEHLDIGLPGEKKFEFDPEDYWKTYEPLRGKRLLLGVEMGMTQEAREANRAFSERVPFDVVIGSIHQLMGHDLYYPELYEKMEKGELYRLYFMTMAREVYQHSFIHVLAHIDYIARYATYENPELEYGEFTEEIDTVLGALVATDTLLELNTRRFGNRLAMKELVPIYCRYRELGGRYITMGSDAHVAASIGANFALAEEFAEECDLRVVTFIEGKMELC